MYNVYMFRIVKNKMFGQIILAGWWLLSEKKYTLKDKLLVPNSGRPGTKYVKHCLRYFSINTSIINCCKKLVKFIFTNFYFCFRLVSTQINACNNAAREVFQLYSVTSKLK